MKKIILFSFAMLMVLGSHPEEDEGEFSVFCTLVVSVP